MTASPMSDAQWARLSEFVAATLGLHYPPERYVDLRRGFLPAAREFGFEDAAACVQWLLSRSPQKAHIQVLASHLTIGETYFFRDQPTLDALANEILPSLIQARRGRDQRLRLWSAACCTGEEAYTLAILLHRLLPDLADWQLTVTATDVNDRFLRKAAAGAYGEWSFRGAPDWLRQDYFERGPDGCHTVIPEIKKLVRFGRLNLVEDADCWQGVDVGVMDIILCRNALMYFTASQMSSVVGKLRACLGRDGWLVVSPSEASRALFPRFASVNFPDAILFQKLEAPLQPASPPATPEPLAPPAPQPVAMAAGADAAAPGSPAAPEAGLPNAPASSDPRAVADALFRSGQYREATEMLMAVFAEPIGDPVVLALLARSLANQGRLADALAWCDRWLQADKLDAAGHYLRGIVLIEQGDAANARAALRRTLYLDGDFILAHLALGNLARGLGNGAEAKTYFSNAQRLLLRHHPDEPLPHSDGLTAGRLAETLRSLTSVEKVS